MSRYLIDTDWIIDVLNDQVTAIDHLTNLAPEGLAVSLISYGELWEGARFARDPERALNGVATFLRGKELLTLSVEIMRRFGDLRGALRRTGQPLGDFDLLIAATAIQHDLVLVTRNVQHFRRIPGLQIFSG